ncbi:thioredoxin-like protein [Polychytrium aggregatum]|uniref:thioredoxin-like protein n=1 Tax=Polychytrium aggregatum TaxID=110093 RepID=UPI0022FF1C60|nr:thioredoxin-like protein [Polychytrium aggregatum]KAI9205210.1 thioredoxin-like protein [Polychytrium aggregatum]
MAPKIISSKAEFDATISLPVAVVDFYATWCGPCKVIAPSFAKWSDIYTNVVFAKVDVDELPDVAEQAKIRAMPTFQIYKNGQLETEIVGAKAADLETAISKANQ